MALYKTQKKTSRKKTPKFIFVVGGVMSGVGKGVTTSSIATVLQSQGLNVTAMKIDPYINVDAGTMNPTEHGEVFVLKNGLETDQDMGNYERFLNTDLPAINYMTTGSVYLSVIEKERNLEYNGKNVEVVPDIPKEVIRRIKKAQKTAKADVVLVEIGGTVGEYQNILFLEAVRMMKTSEPDNVAVVMVSYLPVPGSLGEMKTKPTQTAVRALNSTGVFADMIIARSPLPVDQKRREKIATFCNVKVENVISAPDLKSIYDIPINFNEEGLGQQLCKILNISPKHSSNLKDWKKFVKSSKNGTGTVKIAVVGKYFNSGDFVLSDVYLSVLEAIKYSAYKLGLEPEIHYLSAQAFVDLPDGQAGKKKLKELQKYDGVLVPGGFGTTGIEGKLNVIKYVRENHIPYFGICYGMQLMVLEFAKNVLKLKGASTEEIDPNAKHLVVGVMEDQKEKIANKEMGGTMRLGQYPAALKKGSLIAKAYRQYGKNQTFQFDTDTRHGGPGAGDVHRSTATKTARLRNAGDVLNWGVLERHRHRYEVNNQYVPALEEKGLIFSGTSPHGNLMEVAELPKSLHPFFLGVQFHPELQARPLSPHPLFTAFIKSAYESK